MFLLYVNGYLGMVHIFAVLVWYHESVVEAATVASRVESYWVGVSR